MEKQRQPNSSSLFLVRLWVDEEAGEGAGWRGRVVHVLSGQTHDFKDWQALSAIFLKMMPEAGPSAGPHDGGV